MDFIYKLCSVLLLGIVFIAPIRAMKRTHDQSFGRMQISNKSDEYNKVVELGMLLKEKGAYYVLCMIIDGKDSAKLKLLVSHFKDQLYAKDIQRAIEYATSKKNSGFASNMFSLLLDL